MDKVRAKKHLGQHFLRNREIAQQIAALAPRNVAGALIEIGPGMGVLTEFLYPVWKQDMVCAEIDVESVDYLKQQAWANELKVSNTDILKTGWDTLIQAGNLAVIGNYPYNISTEIAFRVIDNHTSISWFGGMFQKEVAERFCARHGNKDYGVTSVLLQAYYHCVYQFTVGPEHFIPPPKVQSGVMVCTIRPDMPACSLKSLKTVVKTAFGQRRKTLSNALRPLTSSSASFVIPEPWKALRAEQLSVEDFLELATIWENRT